VGNRTAEGLSPRHPPITEAAAASAHENEVLTMTTNVATTSSRGERSPILLTENEIAAVAGGLSLSDFILPKVPPKEPPPVLLPQPAR
jgi:hypothetical protein